MRSRVGRDESGTRSDASKRVRVAEEADGIKEIRGTSHNPGGWVARWVARLEQDVKGVANPVQAATPFASMLRARHHVPPENWAVTRL